MADSGLTSFGIIRKRMADLYLDFAKRIKADDAFGPETTVDSPDSYPGDPLVSIAATSSASTHELWEAVEFFYNQLDPKTAEGIYLERLHANRLGIQRAEGQKDISLRSSIINISNTGLPIFTPVSIALQDPNSECAHLIKSTIQNPVEGIPAPGAMLVVKEKGDVDYSEISQKLWELTDIGLYEYYGDITQQVATPNGGCVEYKIQPACRIFIGLKIHGFFTNNKCTEVYEEQIIQSIRDKLKEEYDKCSFGQVISSSRIRQLIGHTDGFIITKIEVNRRARMLVYSNCTDFDPPKVEINGELVDWSSSKVCGYCQGEIWCDGFLECLNLKQWEFPDFDSQFIEIVHGESNDECL